MRSHAKKFIAHVRRQTQAIREVYAIFFACIGTAIIVLVVSSVHAFFTDDGTISTATQQVDVTSLGPLEVLVRDIGDVIASVRKADLGTIIEGEVRIENPR